jgi:rhodanese-related sulfurtransferase
LAKAECTDGNGNRYNLPRCYYSEISSAQAYLLTTHDQGYVSGDEFAGAVLIDVRAINEYVAGHPSGAWNIPYPRIYRDGINPDILQDPVVFVAAVEERFPDKETSIFTLCRTGFRSVLAANLLAEAGYVNVRNIWEGFVGNHKMDVDDNVLDLNNDGEINDADRDGWANYQGLPWTTQLVPKKLLYMPYYDLY